MACWRSFGVELLPVLLNVWLILGVLLTFILAVWNDHVLTYDKPFPPIPYISNTGSYPPESCIFSFVLSCGAIIVFVLIWIRYSHIKGHYADSPAKLQLLNTVSFYCGFVSILGILIVSSFQDVEVHPVHLTGAFTSFGFGAIYSFLQSCISYKMRKVHPQHVGYCTLCSRIIICLVLLLSAPSAILFGILSRHNCPYLRTYPGPIVPTNCYSYYIISVGSEWISLFLTAVFFLTFHPDFKRINADLQIRLRHHHSDVLESLLDETTPLMI